MWISGDQADAKSWDVHVTSEEVEQQRRGLLRYHLHYILLTEKPWCGPDAVDLVVNDARIEDFGTELTCNINELPCKGWNSITVLVRHNGKAQYGLLVTAIWAVQLQPILTTPQKISPTERTRRCQRWLQAEDNVLLELKKIEPKLTWAKIPEIFSKLCRSRSIPSLQGRYSELSLQLRVAADIPSSFLWLGSFLRFHFLHPPFDEVV